MRAGDCRHFTGIQHDACEADVRYDSVRGTRYPALPCLPSTWRERACETSCPKFEALTAEEERIDLERRSKAFDDAVAGKCPQCGATLDKRENDRVLLLSCPTHGFVMRGCKRVGEDFDHD